MITKPNLDSKVIIPFALALSVIALPSVAQGQASDSSDYMDNLKQCQTIVDDAARLSCFDSAVENVVAASVEGKVRLIDKEDVEETRRGLFGFSLPKLRLFGDEEEIDELETLLTVVKSVRIEGHNTLVLTVEEGAAVWRIPSANYRTLETKPGDTVEFKKASLGSYFIRINGRMGIKGRRVQ